MVFTSKAEHDNYSAAPYFSTIPGSSPAPRYQPCSVLLHEYIC